MTDGFDYCHQLERREFGGRMNPDITVTLYGYSVSAAYPELEMFEVTVAGKYIPSEPTRIQSSGRMRSRALAEQIYASAIATAMVLAITA